MNRLQGDGVPAVPNPSQRFVVLVRLPPVDRLQVLRLQRDPIAGRDPGRGSGTRVVVCPVIRRRLQLVVVGIGGDDDARFRNVSRRSGCLAKFNSFSYLLGYTTG